MLAYIIHKTRGVIDDSRIVNLTSGRNAALDKNRYWEQLSATSKQACLDTLPRLGVWGVDLSGDMTSTLRIELVDF